MLFFTSNFVTYRLNSSEIKVYLSSRINIYFVAIYQSLGLVHIYAVSDCYICTGTAAHSFERVTVLWVIAGKRSWILFEKCTCWATTWNLMMKMYCIFRCDLHAFDEEQQHFEYGYRNTCDLHVLPQ